MRSFENDWIDQHPIPQKFLHVLGTIREYKGKQELYKYQVPQVLDSLQEIASIQSTESSNRIEGIVATPEVIRSLVLEKAVPKNRPEQEIAGYRDVLKTIHYHYKSMLFSENLILQLHQELFQYTTTQAGHWKRVNNEISEIGNDGAKKIRFIPVAAHLTPEYMYLLHQAFKMRFESGIYEPFLLIASYILDFLCIHPFFDGNGRMSRLISHLLLYQAGYEVGRFISLEKIIEQTKDSYYQALYESSRGWHEGKHNLLPWWEYFASILLFAYKELEKRVGTISHKKGSKTIMVLEAIQRMGEFAIRDLQEACPTVGIDLIRTVLKEERLAGRVICLGKGPDAKWRKVIS